MLQGNAEQHVIDSFERAAMDIEFPCAWAAIILCLDRENNYWVGAILLDYRTLEPTVNALGGCS